MNIICDLITDCINMLATRAQQCNNTLHTTTFVNGHHSELVASEPAVFTYFPSEFPFYDPTNMNCKSSSVNKTGTNDENPLLKMIMQCYIIQFKLNFGGGPSVSQSLSPLHGLWTSVHQGYQYLLELSVSSCSCHQ